MWAVPQRRWFHAAGTEHILPVTCDHREQLPPAQVDLGSAVGKQSWTDSLSSTDYATLNHSMFSGPQFPNL
jgi:hypothetical protein